MPAVKWAEVRVEVAAEAVEAATALLWELGAGGVAEDDRGPRPGLVVYWPVDDRLGGRLERLRQGLEGLRDAGLDPGAVVLTVRPVPETDWVEACRAHFQPARVGRRLVVTPPWHLPLPEATAGPDDLVVVIDPGTAFGTGLHPTTRLALEALERSALGGSRVLDAGTGSGILAVAAARLGAAAVTAVDVEPEAVAAAKENVARNGVAGTVKIVRADLVTWLAEPGAAGGPWDVVVANLVSQFFIARASLVAGAVRPGGRWAATGVSLAQTGAVRRALEGAGLRVEATRQAEEWVCLEGSRPAAPPARPGAAPDGGNGAGSMYRVFIDSEPAEGGQVSVGAAAARYLATVVRLRPGDRFGAVTPSGWELVVEVLSASAERVTGRVADRRRVPVEPRLRTTLVQGLAKGDKLDWVVQKATELGVSRIIPAACERSVVRWDARKAAARQRRWQAIAEEAARQSGRLVVPPVEPVTPLAQVPERLDGGDRWLVLWEGERGHGLKEALSGRAPGAGVVLFIGPEGGFSDSEVQTLAGRGAVRVTLGPRILRTETAGLAALAVVLYDAGDLGSPA